MEVRLVPTLTLFRNGPGDLVLPTGLGSSEWDGAHQVTYLIDHFGGVIYSHLFIGFICHPSWLEVTLLFYCFHIGFYLCKLPRDIESDLNNNINFFK